MNNNPYHKSVDLTPYLRKFLLIKLSNLAVASESESKADVSTALETFDRLSKFGGQMALEVACASTNMRGILSDAANYIARELEKLPKDKTYETNSILRLREVYRKLNENISKCQITIGGVDYSKQAIEQATVKIAPCLAEQMYTYTAQGSIAGKDANFVIDVIG